MKLSLACHDMPSLLDGFCDGALSPDEKTSVQGHLTNCPSCRERLRRSMEVRSMLAGAFTKETPPSPAGLGTSQGLPRISTGCLPVMSKGPDGDDASGKGMISFLDRLGSAPWWMISAALHILMIALLGLVTMAVQGIGDQDNVIVVATLEKAVKIQPMEEEKKKSDLREVFDKNHETPATDPNSQVASGIVVPPEILAKAELGDHFETVNPDRPDTQSAFGNPDAHMFHSVSGNDEPAGGGGNGGAGLMDDLIGIGGPSSPGTGGGWGGGNGTGMGVDNGVGHGSFGARNVGGRKLMVMRHGGSKATESAVDKALEWLAKHQEVDGHWDVAKFGGIGDGIAAEAPDVGATGLAVLAFLGAGHTEKVGKYRDNVKRAVYWLIAQQKADGVIYSKFRGNGYCHAVAGLALAESAGMARVAETKAAAQKAVDYSVNIHRFGAKDGSDGGAWRYSKGESPDTSVTGWYVMQLKSAKIAGLRVDAAAFDGASRWLDKVEVDKPKAGDPYSGGTFGYQSNAATYPSITSVGMLCRLYLGNKPDGLGAGVGLLSKNLPDWNRNNANDHPMYYWYYGTLVMFQVGGDEWKAWNESMKKTLVEHQIKGGDGDGSWDPIGREGLRGGRVVCTALGVLSLEVYYRYLPLYR